MGLSGERETEGRVAGVSRETEAAPVDLVPGGIGVAGGEELGVWAAEGGCRGEGGARRYLHPPS